jgi:dihydrofolate reductase
MIFVTEEGPYFAGEENTMTATLIAQIVVSLDGYIENEDHEIDFEFIDAEYDEFILQTLRSLDAMVFGRKAYEPLSLYWPTAVENPDATPVDLEQARLMHELPKYVVSTTLSETDWHNTHILHDVTELEMIKTHYDRPIAIFAGGGIISSASDHGLVEEYRLTVSPVRLGSGTPLFSRSAKRVPLTLTDSRVFGSGAVLLTYRPAAA